MRQSENHDQTNKWKPQNKITQLSSLNGYSLKKWSDKWTSVLPRKFIGGDQYHCPQNILEHIIKTRDM